MSDQEGDDLTIPFFSRLNLRSSANRLLAYGYRVAVAKIAVNRELAVTRYYDS